MHPLVLTPLNWLYSNAKSFIVNIFFLPPERPTNRYIFQSFKHCSLPLFLSFYYICTKLIVAYFDPVIRLIYCKKGLFGADI